MQITGLLTWITCAAPACSCLLCSIFIAYIRFHKAVKAQGVDRSAFPYLAPFQPWFSYCARSPCCLADFADGLFIITVVTFFNGFTVFLDDSFTASGFLTAYITIPIFIAFYLGWKIVKRTSIIPISTSPPFPTPSDPRSGHRPDRRPARARRDGRERASQICQARYVVRAVLGCVLSLLSPADGAQRN